MFGLLMHTIGIGVFRLWSLVRQLLPAQITPENGRYRVAVREREVWSSSKCHCCGELRWTEVDSGAGISPILLSPLKIVYNRNCLA
jgi:hypothetical protein